MTKSEPLVELFRKELIDLTGFLISESLVDSQNIAARRDVGHGIVVLEADYWVSAPRMLGKSDYSELYRLCADSGAYDLRFLDGALVQFHFEFRAGRKGGLRRSGASFLPAPDLTPFQDQPDLYLLDELYGDVVDRRSVSVPLRFDYDSRPEVVEDLHHPESHLTIGQYPHCRVPVTSAVSPYFFIEFILRAFYRTKNWLCTDDLPPPRVALPRTITRREESLLHLSLPAHVR